jgi:hypothetical protein
MQQIYAKCGITGEKVEKKANRAVHKSSGVTGCVVTPLIIRTVPLLIYLTMGSTGLRLYVSEARNLYLYRLNFLPLENDFRFDLVQDRGGSRILYEDCAVISLESNKNTSFLFCSICTSQLIF